MIEINNVTKRFFSLTALDSISLKIPRGEVVGLLGPNGAGKTTLFKLVAGILNPDTGAIRFTGNGWPSIGYKPERLLFPNHLRVRQYLKVMAGVSNIPKSAVEKAVFESLAQVDLLEAAGKRIKDCSKGMRQRLGLAQALIGDPSLLLLDEPSNGLDPEGQMDIHRRIQELHESGKTIVLSSHQLREVTQVCTRLVILNRGQIHYQNSMAEVLALHSYVLIRTDTKLEVMGDSLRALHPGVHVDGDTITLRDEAMALRRQIIVSLLDADFDVTHVEQKRITLAEIYSEAVK